MSGMFIQHALVSITLNGIEAASEVSPQEGKPQGGEQAQ